VLLAPAAGGAPSPSVKASALVVEPGDLPVGFVRLSAQPVSNAAAWAQAGVKKNYESLGRITGYKVVFRKSGAGGIQNLESVANIYRARTGASKSLRATAKALERRRTASLTRMSIGPALGHEARAYRMKIKKGAASIGAALVAWRYRNIYAVVVGAGLEPSFDPARVLEIARLQQARIETRLR
jgi:hypothetical protein